jgi:hypothetical protein
LHSRDDRVCAKTFDRPLTLKTLSTFDAYSFKVVTQIDRDEGKNRIDIISETGDWLRKREKRRGKHLRSAKKIRLIVAFLCDVPYLYELFPNIEIRFQQPWHHNRHMVIVKDAVKPPAAIYFARHHRTPYVTPVFVSRRGDVEVVQTAFDDRWKKATELTR